MMNHYIDKMSKTMYTPGPWRVKYDPNGYTDAVDVQDDRGMSIAWCSVSFQFGKNPAKIGPAEVKANAALIANAPLLLASLKNLLITIGADEQYDWDSAIAQCESAISQAESDDV